MMSTKKMLLMTFLTSQLTFILFLTEAANINSSTVTPHSSEDYITERLNNEQTPEEDDPAADEYEEDLGGSHHQHNDTEESDHHEEDHSHQWNYHKDFGPESWPSTYKECGGIRQSPINIEIHSTKLNELLTEISLLVHKAPGDRITVENNGHSVSFVYDQTTMRLDGGAYDHTYRVVGVHFHWGRDDSDGSEHMIHGEHFPLEMHIVCYNEDDYSGVAEALSSEDGIAVLGVLFTVSDVDNINLQPLISHLKDVRNPEDESESEYFHLEKLLPLNRKNYFRYRGSLTTPPCSESVVWTVFEKTQTISSTQLAEFRSLNERAGSNRTVDHMLFNWRPVQPTLKRIVYRSFPAATGVSHLSSDEPPNDERQQHDRNAATSVALDELFCRRIILIGAITVFLLITTML